MVRIGNWQRLNSKEWHLVKGENTYHAKIEYITRQIHPHHKLRKTKVTVTQNGEVVFDQEYTTYGEALKTMVKLQRILK